MKKYLFDKIIINFDNVSFYLYEEMGFLDFIISDKYGTHACVDKRKGLFRYMPQSLSQLCNCLNKTKLNTNGQYQILFSLGKEKYQSATFEQLLNAFTEQLSKKSKLKNDEIGKYYKTLYKIKEKAQQEYKIKPEPKTNCNEQIR